MNQIQQRLPLGWAESSVSDVALKVTKGTTPTTLGFQYNDEGVLFVKVESLRDGSIDHKKCAFIDDDAHEALARSQLQTGDVLISIAGTLGRVGVVRSNDLPANTNQALAIVRLAPVARPDFVSLAFQAFTARAKSGGRGVGLQNLNLKQIRALDLPLAPLNEQKRIVAKIEALQRHSDAAKEALDAIPALLEKFRQSVLAAAFRGDLTKAWRAENPDVEPASELLGRIPTPPRPNRYKSRSKSVQLGGFALSVGDPQTVLPDSWAWVPLVDVARLESGHTPSRRHPEWWGGSVPWIGIKDARRWHGKTIDRTLQNTNDDGLANSAARLLPKGTVCLSRTASVGYVLVMGRDMATSQDFVNWTCTAAVDNEWLKFLFIAEKQALLSFGKGTTHSTIYFPEVLSFHVALPPIAEQRRIVEAVRTRLDFADSLVEMVRRSATAHASLAPSILAKAFRGELVPQDPNDEPASVLLERIRAEREAAAAAKKPKKRAKSRRRV